MRYIIYPYRMYSHSSRVLAGELDAIRVYPDRNYRPRADDIIINWGNSHVPNWWDRTAFVGRVFNRPQDVRIASNKLRAFRALEEAGVATPRFTDNWGTAREWDQVCVRHNLNGHGGDGIEIVNAGEGYLPEAPLYTEFISPKAEYRVHVFNGQVIDYTKKRRRIEDEPTLEEDQIRSHENGWIFTRGNLRRLERIEQLAIDAVEAVGLDFGAVDIIKDDNNVCYVLEINTACGMADTTLENYAEAIRNL